MRLSWDEYFMEIVLTARKRATCNRGRTACVITKNNHILATGYVGSVSGSHHCDEVGHLIENGSCIRTLHAEANAVAQCAKMGISIDEATIYCFLFPCLSCAKLLIQCGIKKVIALYDYKASIRSKQFFDEAKVEWVLKNDKIYEYKEYTMIVS